MKWSCDRVPVKGDIRVCLKMKTKKENQMEKIGVIGSGSFGTALSVLLADKGMEVFVTGRNKEHLVLMDKERENKKYLPGVKLPENIHFVMDEEEVIKDAEILMFAVPAQSFGKVLESVKEFVGEDTVVVNVAKGIERGSLRTLSQVAYDTIPGIKYVALSGPSHAEEVGQGLPTTVVAASKDIELAKLVQEVYMTDRFRVYTNEDLMGVELGGALKNIMALGAGVSDGLGFGDNAKAAMMTRGIAEISRLGVKMGADEITFLGLAGIGDLIVTCTSMHSRNRRCGILIGEGVRPKEAVKEIGMVVEGIYTCEAACKLAEREGVEMPITQIIMRCLQEEISADEAINELMGRSPKDENHKGYHLN